MFFIQRKYSSEARSTVNQERPFSWVSFQNALCILEHYPDEKKDALEHLDFAIKEFREMKMQPSLERALRHKRSCHLQVKIASLSSPLQLIADKSLLCASY